MTIAEWVNEAPGRQIVITACDRPEFVRFHVRCRVLGKQAACNIDVKESMLFDVDHASNLIVEEIKEATERLIYSIKDRN